MKSEFMALGLIMILLMIGGCATNSSTANVVPGVDLTKYSSIYVVKPEADKRDTNQLIGERLVDYGYEVTTGDQGKVPETSDVILTYRDKWVWDITLFMIELNVHLADAKTGIPLANANSYHSSITRKSPKKMVDEVLRNVFEDAESSYSSDTLNPLSAASMTLHFDEPFLKKLPIRVNVLGQGVGVAPDKSFHTALLESVRNSKIFLDVTEDGSGEYTLVASLLNVTPNYLETKVSVDADWILYRTSDRQAVLQTRVHTEGSKSVALFARMRRKTNAEHALQKNILNGLEKITEIQLQR